MKLFQGPAFPPIALNSPKRHLPMSVAIAMLAACGSEPQPAEPPAAAVAAANTSDPLPGGFTQYPGAQQVSRTSINQNGGSYTLLAQQADAVPAEMVAFYRAQAEAAGITISLEASASGMHQIGGETASGLNFSFTASPAGTGSSTTLAIGQAAPQ